MNPLLLPLYAILIALSSVNGDQWAVLVAGSNGWMNYRHQAAVAHAYHMLRSKGFAQEKIITMMYDDIAHNRENPFPGKIFVDYDHVDYYQGIQIDFKEDDVTPNNFLKVLAGSAELKAQNKKVLESGPDDDVFIFFSDHGSSGLICFPDEELFASTFQNALKKMHEEKRYKNLVFYLEACESGSMFEDLLPETWNIYATTSANPEESGYACFCEDPQIDTCLGDEYSIQWVGDSEHHNLKKRTLMEQYLAVKKGTESSHVSLYGDKNLGALFVSEFQGENSTAKKDSKHFMKPRDKISSRKAHLVPLYRLLSGGGNGPEQELARLKLEHSMQMDQAVRSAFNYISNKINFGKTSQTSSKLSKSEYLPCYETAVKAFTKKCFKIQKVPEVSNHLRKFQEACQNNIPAKVILDAIDDIC